MKPNGRDEWRVILGLLRLIRLFNALQRKELLTYGLAIERGQP